MKITLVALLLGFCLPAAAVPARYEITASGNRVQFESAAPLENVVGTTQAVYGFVEFDEAAAQEQGRAEVRVDLTVLKTGIELRDSHMRDNHLETDQFPAALFTLVSLTLPESGLVAGVRTRVNVRGTLDLHGVQRSITPDVYMTLAPSGGSESLKIEAAFSVKLSDYNIKRPQFLVMKLAEAQSVTVELRAVRVADAATGQ